MRSSENRFSSVLKRIRVSEIDEEPFKNRRVLSNIDELACSIKRQGLLVPLIVRKKGNSRYDLVSGHRRLSALRTLGWKYVECITVDGSDDKMSQFAIVENIQREDLSDYEKALTFRVLHDKYHMTYSAIGDATGKSKQFVSNHIAMLSLLNGLNDEEDRKKAISILLSLTEHHVRVLLQVKDPEKRLALAKYAEDNRLNVRQLERVVSQQRLFLSKDAPLQPAKVSSKVMHGKFVIAVEGSSEKTICRVYNMDTSKPIGEYKFGPANHHIMGVHQTALTIADGVRDSMNYAG
ncbi:MAG: ParB/RepB/Spo0J family partition protein, partial [Nitrososphaerota archaeon]|nr:ParB/RepB/Spo0J family partition protein [Nitrososphaerota archaeon]